MIVTFPHIHLFCKLAYNEKMNNEDDSFIKND